MLALLWTVACFGTAEGRREARDGRHDGAREDRGIERVAVGADDRGEERSFFVHVPEGAKGPLPAVFVFHGGQGKDARDFARNWQDQLDRGMILVFPNGQLTRPDRGGFDTEVGDLFQVHNVERIVERVVRDYGADPKRLFAAGFSGGAEMVDQLACHAPDTFRAFAHGGRTLLRERMEACATPTSRPQMFLIGTADDRAPPEGKRDEGGTSWRQVPMVDALAFWLRAAGCPPETSKSVVLPDRGDRAEFEVRTWTGCAHAAGMRYVEMRGLGHDWPTGASARELNATHAVLEFFREFGGL